MAQTDPKSSGRDRHQHAKKKMKNEKMIVKEASTASFEYRYCLFQGFEVFVDVRL